MSTHVTKEEACNPDPITINQLMVDHFATAHGKCMDHCLNKHHPAYTVHKSIFDLIGQELYYTACEVEHYVQHCRRYDVPIPPRERMLRKAQALREKRHSAHPVGSLITVKADEVLGTEPFPARVRSHEQYGFRVEASSGWIGPIDFQHYPLQDLPFKVR